ncbi:hypothetical protein KGA66_04430 [Actinocrinis puniceicyclus]|uniref:Uncharacterized protein n=1 Tax=Actinocrinis puniceicyclus TaxID=977794 RepID=A0A8J7WMQ3_9ACTN|nr:hypothetical protein [Actinocrinis puniceicyclus]MBS2962280.1 hypothetical protein [Actinocrinis puniceicyclus]
MTGLRTVKHSPATLHDPAPRRESAHSHGHGRPLRATFSHDRVALDEIELYAELIIAAQRSDKPLSSADIDAVLGLRPGEPARSR